jgi:peroxiredoxin Q/BCP
MTKELAKKTKIGDKVPEWTFESTDPNLHAFGDLLGQNIVLYFYPRDNTPGCTLEGKDFRDLLPEFAVLNTKIVGVSRDSLRCHQTFGLKHGLSFPLISDKDEKLCRYFDVMIEKNIFLKILLGIERSTFLIDKQGVIKHIWRKVKVKGHAQEVLKVVNDLERVP